jgi:hypothetical protein
MDLVQVLATFRDVSSSDYVSNEESKQNSYIKLKVRVT